MEFEYRPPEIPDLSQVLVQNELRFELFQDHTLRKPELLGMPAHLSTHAHVYATR